MSDNWSCTPRELGIEALVLKSKFSLRMAAWCESVVGHWSVRVLRNLLTPWMLSRLLEPVMPVPVLSEFALAFVPVPHPQVAPLLTGCF